MHAVASSVQSKAADTIVVAKVVMQAAALDAHCRSLPGRLNMSHSAPLVSHPEFQREVQHPSRESRSVGAGIIIRNQLVHIFIKKDTVIC
jgi:hypothetical protein